VRYSDLVTNRASLTSRRTVLTHMSADMLARAGEGQLAFEAARDGLVIPL
jgi:phosphoribosyl 1,2-cyclic phosphodiesterase